MKATLRRALIFTLILLPVAAVGAYFTALYQIDMLGEEMMAEVLAQLGSVNTFVVVYIVQTVVYMLFMGFGGYLLAEKTGLMKPFRLEKATVAKTLPLCVLAGALFSLDYWTFGAWVPAIREATDATLSFHVVMASVVYGGVVEEVMMRLFFMSLLSFLGWKIFFRKQEKAPVGVIVAANVIAALLFAAGHLPATTLIFGEITPLLLFRCFLFNGGFGLFFGWMYRKYGFQYAILGHMLAHIVSKLIWFLFV